MKSMIASQTLALGFSTTILEQEQLNLRPILVFVYSKHLYSPLIPFARSYNLPVDRAFPCIAL